LLSFIICHFKNPLDKISKICKISTLDLEVLTAIFKLSVIRFNILTRRSQVNLKPLADRIIVKPLEAEDVTKGGIVLPDTAKEKPQEGEVVAVGDGKVLDNGQVQALTVKVKDRVLYGKYSGTEITTKDGQELLIMREDDVLAIVK